ncbi:nucleolar protein 3-like [Panicum miliaceum]|uniref:Nucleolar protein 3-like n=1 Tax=Panicum miliaceum TaxID=4540 RepID=A0A3L6TEK8_PANMI|nr:nucleolar protein 3-like [Panicum miliaceum]
MEDQDDGGEHVKDYDPAALEAEAARRAAAGGGCRGHGAGPGRGAGFGNFGVPNRQPQFFGCARRVPIVGAAGFDGDADFDYQDDHRAGHHGNRGGYDDRGGAPFGHFGAFGDHQFADHSMPSSSCFNILRNDGVYTRAWDDDGFCPPTVW